MTSALVSAAAASEAGSARVTRSGPASAATRIVSPLLASTVRPVLEALTFAGKVLPVRTKWVFAASRLVDAPAAVLAPPRDARRRQHLLDGFRAEWLWHDTTVDLMTGADAAMVYFHGGGFITCGLNTHRRMVAKIAAAARLPVLAVEYRQLPSAHIVQSVEDCRSAYLHLLDVGFPAERIVLCGDSAGAGLAFLLSLRLRDDGLPLPGAIVAISPWSDLDDAARCAHPNAGRDPYIPSDALGMVARWGFAAAGGRGLDPAWSPVNHDFTGLPPVLIQVGSTEVLMSDAERLAQRCAEAGVDCEMQVWDRAPHVFHILSDVLPEARAAITAIGAFAQRTVHAARPARAPAA
ncbi:MAG: alpha/beta hydrolase [Mycobacteriaceae bacterium]|nr:alpha/beta hydrolase [Mycobacteriaceae bacterium]